MPTPLALPSGETITSIAAVIALAALAALGWSGAGEARRQATADAFDAAWRAASAEVVAWDEARAAELTRWRAGDATSPPAGMRAVALAFSAQPRPQDVRLRAALRADRDRTDVLRDLTTLARDASLDDDVRALAWADATRIDPTSAGSPDDLHPRNDRARFAIDRERARSGFDVEAFVARSTGIGPDAYAGVPPLERAYALRDVAPDATLGDDLRAFDALLLEPDRGGAVRFACADGREALAWRHSTRTDETRLAWITIADATRAVLALAPDRIAVSPTATRPDERGLELRTLPLRVAPGAAMHEQADAAGAAVHATRLAQVIAALLACGACAMLLVRLAARRRDLERQRNDFVCSVTHELKTPLANVLLYAETLERLDGSDPAKVPEFARTIRAEAERLRGRIQQVLDVAAGRDAIEAAPGATFDPLAVVEAVLAEATPGARANGAALVIASHAPIPRVRGSLELLAQAVSGLVDNAVKFGGANTVRIRVRAAQDEVWIDVADEGPGIAPRDRPHVFEPFWRASSAVLQATPGSGLGLALVKRCVERLRGRVELLVTPAVRGATFRIALPAEA